MQPETSAPDIEEPLYWTAPPLFAGGTIVCIGAGPSLTPAQIKRVMDWRQGADTAPRAVLAVNTALRWCPDADAAMVLNGGWVGEETDEARADRAMFAGFADRGRLLVTLNARFRGLMKRSPNGATRAKLMLIRAREGLDRDPQHLAHGMNNGHAALNLAWHLLGGHQAAKRGGIVLVGYDMKPGRDGRTQFDGGRPSGHPEMYGQQFVPLFERIAADLKDSGVRVVNATPGSALPWFPKMSLAAALKAGGDDHSQHSVQPEERD